MVNNTAAKTENNDPQRSESSAQKDATAMKAVMVNSFTKDSGEFVDCIEFTESAPKPSLSNKPRWKEMVIRVLACSISSGDTVTMKGNAIFMRPQLPFIPGSDVCGTVEVIGQGVTEFAVGDVVVANNGTFAEGGLAEYMVISAHKAVLKPAGIDVVEAAACGSAVTSLHAVDNVKIGDRVLVLGGSGGVGTTAITLAKGVGASFVATTAPDEDETLCKALGADLVIGCNENWWEFKEFQENKFDKIIDTDGGGNYTNNAAEVLKPGHDGGNFIAAKDNTLINADPWVQAISFISKVPIWWIGQLNFFTYLCDTFKWRTSPRFVVPLNDEINGLTRVLNLMEVGKLQIFLDPSCPLPFTEGGVKKAFVLQGSGGAKGKVVVKMDVK